MALLKKQEKSEKYVFSGNTIKHFVKEMVQVGFDFDAFLINKGAIRKRDGKIVVLSYEHRDSYLAKHVNRTPYYSLEVAMLEWAWQTPYCFWYELKDQAMSELVREVWNVESNEHTRTGKSYTERAKDKVNEMRGSLTGLVTSKSVNKVHA